MPTTVQFRRGTTAQNLAFTGSAGEITVDTTEDRLIVHDGTLQVVHVKPKRQKQYSKSLQMTQ